MFRFLAASISALFLFAFISAAGGLYVLWHYGRGLPDYLQLADYEPAITSRFYAGDGRLLAEFAKQKRFFVPLEAMPKRLVGAFLAAEDKNFMTHPGVDITGVARAVLVNIKNYGSGRRMVGASTITQQVAKNFLLTSEVSFTRKIKEAILAFRIERTFSKEHILELYLNEIYLGYRSYGVSAAAMNYFNKSLSELDLSEIAFLAALPKGPNNYNPKTKYDAAIARRNWVLDRMAEDDVVSRMEAVAAKNEPIEIRQRDETEIVTNSEYFTEEVRREIVDKYGNDALYEEGLAVRTSVDPKLQKIATKAVRKGLLRYDRDYGWRGAITNITFEPDMWLEALAEVETPAGALENWMLAVVLDTDANKAEIGTLEGSIGEIPLKRLKWAKRPIDYEDDTKNVDREVTKPDDVLNIGDVVLVEPARNASGEYNLRQIPKAEASLVALDPHTGRVLAMVGGFDFQKSQFNRAVQATRQPGSAFKPFVYLAALDHGYTPASLILDAPFVLDQGPGKPKWKPQNYSNIFYGPTTLRMGVEKSRNLMTVRLGQALGPELVSEYAKKFGINDNLPPLLSMSLGAGETTALKLTSAYAMLVNGGKRITPSLIDRIQDRKGRTVYRHDNRPCIGCRAIFWENQSVPQVPDLREQITDPMSAYQMVSILKGVVQYGTGYRVKRVKKPIAGKTGTTNNNVDAWFVGFSPDLAVGVFVGYDEPRTLGKNETGSRAASPIFTDFMAGALKGKPAIPFRMPSGIRLVRINHKTGLPAKEGDKFVITEAFKPGADITGKREVLGQDASIEVEAEDAVAPAVGDLY